MEKNFPQVKSRTLLLATTNRHKIEEIIAICRTAGLTDWEFRTLEDYPDYVAPEETGATFSVNASIKAAHAARMSGLLTLADDSGLEVECLDGEPGVFSARYAGMEQDDAANRAKLLYVMENVPKKNRKASFVCWVSIAFPDAHSDRDDELNMWMAEGRCEGEITFEEQGENGFGYDSIFYLPKYGATMAQLEPNLKNQVSHRHMAVVKAADWLAHKYYKRG